MIRLEAKTIEEALLRAAQELSCSVADLDYEVIQQPRAGFLGFGKRDAEIVASLVSASSAKESARFPASSEQKAQNDFPKALNKRRESHYKKAQNGRDSYRDSYKSGEFKRDFHRWESQSAHDSYKSEESLYKQDEDDYAFSYVEEREEVRPMVLAKEEGKKTLPPQDKHRAFGASASFERLQSSIDESFFQSDEDIDSVARDVEDELNMLFAKLPFKIERIRVSPFDENTLYVEFRGEDSALLIGKEGYRYKAISYLLFNWINSKYGLMVRLEIAEFLRNQEEMIRNYLAPVVENIKRFGKGQTRPLDGVLAHIALRHLREEFPDKYVSFRLDSEGERYVIVNDFAR